MRTGFFLVDTRADRVWVDMRNVLVQTLVVQSDALTDPDGCSMRPNMPLAPEKLRDTESLEQKNLTERFVAGVFE